MIFGLKNNNQRIVQLTYYQITFWGLCIQCLAPLMLWFQILIRVMCTTLCDKVCQWHPTGRWFSTGPLVSSTNKTDRHDIAEVLLKVALNTIKQKQNQITLRQISFSLIYINISSVSSLHGNVNKSIMLSLTVVIESCIWFPQYKSISHKSHF
jgi:hypothetical protein